MYIGAPVARAPPGPCVPCAAPPQVAPAHTHSTVNEPAAQRHSKSSDRPFSPPATRDGGGGGSMGYVVSACNLVCASVCVCVCCMWGVEERAGV